MRKESAAAKVRKTQGEKIMILLTKLGIADKELKIERNMDFIYVPLNRQLSDKELKMLREQAPSLETLTYTFLEKKKVITFAELLEKRLPPHLLASLPRAIDFVGDIAIIEIPPELDAYKSKIGEAILEVHKNMRTVLAKAGIVGGTYRLREFTVVAGEPKTETIHKEYGCQYHVDLAKAYFSPRLSYEHQRVASQVKDGEIVIDLFAGVGPFAIQIAKVHKNVKVYAIDVNPDAIKLLKRNVRLNRVEDKVYPILGDAKQIVEEKFSSVADGVIMNLPEKAMEFVETACKAVKPTCGMVHFYSFVSSSDSLENVKLRFIETVEKCERKLEKVIFFRFVRATAPHEWQVVLDAKIC